MGEKTRNPPTFRLAGSEKRFLRFDAERPALVALEVRGENSEFGGRACVRLTDPSGDQIQSSHIGYSMRSLTDSLVSRNLFCLVFPFDAAVIETADTTACFNDAKHLLSFIFRDAVVFIAAGVELNSQDAVAELEPLHVRGIRCFCTRNCHKSRRHVGNLVVCFLLLSAAHLHLLERKLMRVRLFQLGQFVLAVCLLV